MKFKKGDRVLFCDDDGFGIETVLDCLGDYIITDRTKNLKDWDVWQLADNYCLNRGRG